jgi:hypothetical protein
MDASSPARKAHAHEIQENQVEAGMTRAFHFYSSFILGVLLMGR